MSLHVSSGLFLMNKNLLLIRNDPFLMNEEPLRVCKDPSLMGNDASRMGIGIFPPTSYFLLYQNYN